MNSDLTNFVTNSAPNKWIVTHGYDLPCGNLDRMKSMLLIFFNQWEKSSFSTQSPEEQHLTVSFNFSVDCFKENE